MKITILGAGVIGVTSAYYLRKKGYDVEVIDRQSEVAMETSFANGGQISVCYSEPWSTVTNLKKMYSWLGKEESPILFRPEMNFNQIQWGLKFLKECIPSNTESNIKKMLKLAIFSRNSLKQLREETGIKYNHLESGILTYYTSRASYEAGIKAAEFMNQFGSGREIKNQDETFAIEPCLKNAKFTIFGADFSPSDESGDAKLFTENLANICKKMGVVFTMEEEILFDKIEYSDNNQLSKVFTKNTKTGLVSKHTSETFLVCLGSYSPLFLKKLESTPIYPVKGYSATFKVKDWTKVNKASLTDSEYKIVFTRIGDELRVAGTAEFNGYNLELNTERCEALRKRTKEVFGDALDYEEANFWTGLRPATPGNVPIIKRIKDSNVYINSGHGTLGWTMACGSGRAISEIIK